MLEVRIHGKQKQYQKGISFYELAREYQKEYEHDIVLVMLNGKLQELHKSLEKEGELSFITTADDAGMRSYKRSVSQLLLKAIYDVAEQDDIEKVSILFSLSKGYYCKITGKALLTQEFLEKVKERMRELVKMDIPIKKKSIHTDEAIAMFRNHHMYDKERLFRYRRVSKVNIYTINEFEDYYCATRF